MYEKILTQLQEEHTNVSIDTRTIAKGDIYIAIKGEKFDGHSFVREAITKGASVCIVEKNNTYIQDIEATHLLYVEDTTKALHELAGTYRDMFDIPVIGISGCNGKTTTKNMLASVCKAYVGEEAVLYTQKNNNNDIGVSLTILSLRKTHKLAVIELGSNHKGEIELLCSIAKPTHGITTNIGAAHIEFFGTLEAIADEEGFIGTTLPENGSYVLLEKDTYTKYISKKTKANVQLAGKLYIEHIYDTEDILQKLSGIGISAPHLVDDALLVLTMSHILNIPLDTVLSGLASATNDRGRFHIQNVIIQNTKCILIDDTYNANPDSVIASIKATATLYPTQQKILVLGELKELGTYLRTGYGRINEALKEYTFSEVIYVGIDASLLHTDSAAFQKTHCPSNSEAISYITTHCKADAVILCKGSNGAKMWEVVQGLSK
ncbi:MAG: UDP-N-acetylmuramoyl-tripeptide--D-alanyl-D-alanine ligase [Candidatus Taylorbacteria bacterium]|nr:UDP-N-acetylmuramoyl-tripeptide--D-alanyl-D-alanine ligase [Candidatus Taylorbacteria bacterium]